MDLPPLVVIGAILVIYFILGCFMESMAMVLLTLPIFVPLMLGLDFGHGSAAGAGLVRHPGAGASRSG